MERSLFRGGPLWGSSGTESRHEAASRNIPSLFPLLWNRNPSHFLSWARSVAFAFHTVFDRIEEVDNN